MKPKTFNEVREFLNDIPDINLGGCGVAALSMYRWLIKHGHDCDIVYLYDDIDDGIYENNDYCLSNGQEQGMESCSHAVILFDGNVWDSCEYYPEEDLDNNDLTFIDHYFYTYHILPESYVIRSVNNIGYWNEMFDRSFVPEIEEMLEIDLSDIRY